MERFKRFRFKRFRRFLCKKGFSVFPYSSTGKDGSGSGFGSWKTVPAVPVPLSVSGKTVPTVHLGTLALKTGILVKKSVGLVKRESGFTKTVPWTENPGKIRRRAF